MEVVQKLLSLVYIIPNENIKISIFENNNALWALFAAFPERFSYDVNKFALICGEKIINDEQTKLFGRKPNMQLAANIINSSLPDTFKELHLLNINFFFMLFHKEKNPLAKAEITCSLPAVKKKLLRYVMINKLPMIFTRFKCIDSDPWYIEEKKKVITY